jgi:heptosyltransferase-1
MRLLIVKTSSMGDVVHAQPVVHDVRTAVQGVEIDWLVEAPFAAIPQLNPGVRRVVPMRWRAWRRQLWQAGTWRAMSALREQLRAAQYDLVLDLQGLVKSALWARMAGAPVAGYERDSAREPLAALAYTFRGRVTRELQAVERCRRLAAQTIGYSLPPTPPRFGLVAPPAQKLAGWQPRGDYSVLIPNASRREKLWPERSWVSVGQRMAERGFTPVVLWGRPDEQTLAEHIAAGCEGEVPPFLPVADMAAVLAGAHQVVGLDTGFTHLAAAFGRPTVGIYCDHDPGLAGITGPGPVASTGGKGRVPTLREVLGLVEQQMG